MICIWPLKCGTYWLDDILAWANKTNSMTCHQQRLWSTWASDQSLPPAWSWVRSYSLLFSWGPSQWQYLFLFGILWPSTLFRWCLASQLTNTFPGQVYQHLPPVFSAHSFVTDNFPTWISGMERMAIENILWPISTKVMSPGWGANLWPADCTTQHGC